MAVAVLGGSLGQADDDEAAIGRVKDFDRDAVEAAERLGGDDLSRGSG
jgi:hypothetical protein